MDVKYDDIFTRLYGKNIKRNPYLSYYLNYIYERSKPALSQLIYKRLKEAGPDKYLFKYSFNEISKDQGWHF